MTHDFNSYKNFYQVYDQFVNLMFIKHLTK